MRAINRDPEAATSGLRAVFLQHRPALLRYLAARRIAPDEAEDLLQDLYIKLAGAAPGPIAEPRAYLYRMTENLLLDLRRSASRRAGREQAWTSAQLGPALAADDRPSAEQALIARERLAAVADALAALPERTVQIFRRYRIEGLAQKEIAAEFGISLSAVEKHLQKAYRVVAEAQALLDADMPVPRRPEDDER